MNVRGFGGSAFFVGLVLSDSDTRKYGSSFEPALKAHIPQSYNYTTEHENEIELRIISKTLFYIDGSKYSSGSILSMNELGCALKLQVTTTGSGFL